MKGDRERGFVFLLLLGVLAGIALLFVLARYTSLLSPAPENAENEAARPPSEAPSAPASVTPPEPGVQHAARMAIVIDDVGQDMSKVSALLEIEAQITLAVLPHQRFSREAALKAHESGREVILHLPMEPRDQVNDPGKGALTTRMGEDELKRTTESDIASVPHAGGVNNHMGSRFTEDEARMRTVLGVLKERELFYLDSLTSPRSAASRIARDMGIPSASRSVFLDNVRERDEIKARLRELIRAAKRNGSAIGIGHPYPETIEALRESIEEIQTSGVEIVGLSKVLDKGK